MKIIEELEGLVSSKINVMKSIFAIFKLEARLAGLSILPLVLSLIILLVVFLTVWLTTMVLIGYGMVLAFDQKFLAIFLILVLNVIFFIGLLNYIRYNLGNMSFEKTRSILSLKEGDKHGELQKADNSQNCNDGKSITLPTT